MKDTTVDFVPNWGPCAICPIGWTGPCVCHVTQRIFLTHYTYTVPPISTAGCLVTVGPGVVAIPVLLNAQL